MKKIKRIVGAIMLICAMLVGGCTVGQTMASVNGERISRSDLDKRMDPLKKLYQAQFGMDFSKEDSKETLKKLEADVLQQMITEKLILQEAQKEGIKITKDEINKEIDKIIKERFPSPKAFEEFMKKQGFARSDLQSELSSQLTGQKLADRIIQKKKITVSEQEAKKYFQEHQDQYNVPELVRASHILVKDKKQAEEILLHLQKGEEFAQLAKKYSLDPGSKEKGGDLGYFSRGQMVPIFEKTAFSLEKNQISGIIQTNYGYHIIKVEDHKQPQNFQFQQLREEVKKQLEEKKKKEVWMQFLADLHAQGKIKINR